MKKRNKKHEKRLKRLIVTCLLCAIILTVSTYAWFIGMQTVTVNAFEVNIASVEDLALSLDGTENSWSTELNITEDDLKGNAYAATTYSWTGLSPMSTIGEINSTSSKMVLYEKGSLTASDGGYRLMSEPVANTTAEVDGYVAFDLFIKNMSGEAYYPAITNPSNEEAIYLDTESSVTAKSGGTDTSGIENSVRVAFAQIGRVKSDSAASNIQAISCAEDVEGMTPICKNRYATIWEPNDKDHETNAITWFNKTCKTRNTDTGAYTTTACTSIANGTAYTTYAISGAIDHEAGVDVYDGLNGYQGTISETAAKNKLVGIDTFTDTEKLIPAENRPEFMTLAPNSVTKVRVYVYLEGQDVDNYDFASLGSNIVVNFGFTKERFTETEILGEQQTEENA